MSRKLVEVWNKTGTIVGRISRSDLVYLIRDSCKPEMRERFARWIVLLEGDEEFVVSLPYTGEEKPTIEE